jgi:serine/threonine-protein kinase
MRCPVCAQHYPDETVYCASDGTRLVPETEQIDDPLLGRVLDGRYRILSQIGAGGMGTVYCAEQVNIGRQVAVKVLRRHPGGDDESVRRFELEAQIISKLRHPNTLTLIDYGQATDGVVYIVTELLLGQTLDDALAGGPMDVAETLTILSQICGSLAEAHAQGIVHRDIKPGNIFLEQVEGQIVVRVLDFGIAKFAQQATQTTTGRVYGTPLYMSPEQASGEKNIDHRSDLYSVGVIAYECLAGLPPFEAETPLGLVYKHVKEVPKSLLEIHPPLNVSPSVNKIVQELLAKSPGDRPQEAKTVSRRLERLAQRLNPLTISVSDFPEILPPKKSHRRIVLLGLLGLAVLAGALIWTQSGPGEGELPSSASSEVGSDAGAAPDAPPAPEAVPERATKVAPVTPPTPAEAAPKTVAFIITSTPAGASVKVGGQEVGVTPVTVTRTLSPDTVTVVVQKNGFLPQTQMVTAEEARSLKFPLKPRTTRKKSGIMRTR